MEIKKSKFEISAGNAHQFLKEVPQIAFVGKSNVGKSSLINFLTNNYKLAKTSSTPGKTKLVNYFLINENFYFVDLPGYGFAKASKTESQAWKKLIEAYFEETSKLLCVCLLVDIRHDITENDAQMINYLFHYTIPFIVIATKSDKIAKSKVDNYLTSLSKSIKIAKGNLLAVSVLNKTGKEQILLKLSQFINDND